MPSESERVAVDAELLAAARRRYTGRGDLADQLWWLEHPGSRGPSGAEDPARALEAARAALFRPDRPGDADPEEVGRRLALLDADRAAARAAVESARVERARTGPAATTARRRRPAAPIAVAVAALLVGLAVGFGTGRFTGTTAPAALAVFAAPQRSRDVPPSSAELPPLAPRSAYRLLASSPTTGAYAYGVRRSDGRVCLVAVVLARSTFSTCTTLAAFAAAGLTLAFQAEVDPEDDSGAAPPVSIEPHWAPDGRVTF